MIEQQNRGKLWENMLASMLKNAQSFFRLSDFHSEALVYSKINQDLLRDFAERILGFATIEKSVRKSNFTQIHMIEMTKD